MFLVWRLVWRGVCELDQMVELIQKLLAGGVDLRVGGLAAARQTDHQRQRRIKQHRLQILTTPKLWVQSWLRNQVEKDINHWIRSGKENGMLPFIHWLAQKVAKWIHFRKLYNLLFPAGVHLPLKIFWKARYSPCPSSHSPQCRLGTFLHTATGDDVLTAPAGRCRSRLAGFHNLTTRNSHFQCTATRHNISEGKADQSSYVLGFLVEMDGQCEHSRPLVKSGRKVLPGAVQPTCHSPAEMYMNNKTFLKGCPTSRDPPRSGRPLSACWPPSGSGRCSHKHSENTMVG